MRPLRVLVADDNSTFAQSLCLTLSEDERIDVVGYAANGAEAVAMAASLDPDVVVMDLEMPVMDGIEATRRISVRDEARIVFLTGSDAPADVVRARAAGAFGFLRKGMPTSELLAGVIAAGVARRRAQLSRARA